MQELNRWQTERKAEFSTMQVITIKIFGLSAFAGI